MKPLQRSRKDLAVTGTIAMAACLAVAGVWATAPIRDVHQQLASPPIASTAAPSQAPSAVHEAWRAPSEATLPRPLVADGVPIAFEGTHVAGLDPATGEQRWTYDRGQVPCAVGQAWSTVVLDFHTGRGCGDVVGLSAKDGSYKATRSAHARSDVAVVSSNDRVGIVAGDRLELWRSDLVRTVEYGTIDIQQEPDEQPHPGCQISSALTRTSTLAVVERCEDGTWLRFQATTPEDSKVPEVASDIAVDPGAQLIALDAKAAAVYVPPTANTQAHIISYREDGTQADSQAVAPSPLADAAASGDAEGFAFGGGVFTPQVADLPHAMSWYDGERLYLFNPGDLHMLRVIGQAIGPGVAIGEDLVVPTQTGLDVVQMQTGKVLRSLPVQRGDYRGEVALQLAGGTIVEQRGTTMVGLLPNA